MKLLMENWRKHLDEMVDETPTWGVLVKTDQMIPKMVGYHASSAVFNQFDNSRLGSNTDMGKAGEGKYNLDSYLGHMFVPDAQQLTPHMKKLRSRYIYSVTLTPGRVAVIDIRQFKKWFGKDEPNAKARLRQFGEWLKSKGYGGLRYTDSQSDTTLLSDTVQVFDAGNTNIRSIWDTETDKRFRAKDLQGRSFADVFKESRENTTLTEISVFEKDAAVSTILDRMGKSEYYPEVENARVFVNRQAAMLMARVPMVWTMLRVMNQDQSITEQDVLEILLQRALKGRTFEALTKSEQEYMKKYGLKYPEESEEEPIEIPQYSREDIPPELMDAGTQVFIPDYAKREGLIREGDNEENRVAVADALLSLALNANMQGGIGPQVLFKLNDEQLKQQIQTHNHRKDEVSDEELYNYIRG